MGDSFRLKDFHLLQKEADWLKEIRLGKAEDLEMLQAVKARYIKASWRSYNNIYLLDRFLEEGSAAGGVSGRSGRRCCLSG